MLKKKKNHEKTHWEFISVHIKIISLMFMKHAKKDICNEKQFEKFSPDTSNWKVSCLWRYSNNFQAEVDWINILGLMHVKSFLFVKHASKNFFRNYHLNTDWRFHTREIWMFLKHARKDLQGNLNFHFSYCFRLHSGEKPHVCVICNKRFS